MREFLKQIAKDLYALTGLKQVEQMNQQEAAIFINSLLHTCNRFGRIPDNIKQKIIREKVLCDPDLKKLTPAKVYQWLSDYWNALDHATRQKFMIDPTEEKEHKPCSPEEAQKYIDKWKAQVNSMIDKNQTEAKSIKASTRFYGREMAAVSISQKIVDCPECQNKDELKDMCTSCNRFGKIKKTLNVL